MKKFIKEFKEFAIKGNVSDLAVGVVIGGAFGKIVSSLVADIIMPAIGIILGGIDFTELKWTVMLNGREPVELTYGNFIQNVVDFLIIALCIFIVIRFINRITHLRREDEKEKAEKEPKVVTELDVLTEIRDLLRKQVKKNK